MKKIFFKSDKNSRLFLITQLLYSALKPNWNELTDSLIIKLIKLKITSMCEMTIK